MPSKTSRESGNAILSKLDQKKRALEESRVRLVNEIERIDESLKEIQAEYGKIANELCPLLNLPTEVACTIFELCVTSHNLEDSKAGEKLLLPEVVISHVCKQWRGASLNYPRLWTRFCFRADNVESMKNPLARFGTYIERSSSQNLELFLDFRRECLGRQYPPQKEQHHLMAMAFKEIKRWKIVTLLSDRTWEVEGHFPDLLTAPAPNLEYFAYLPMCPAVSTTTIRSKAAKNPSPRIFQGGTPKLRYLLLDSSSRLRIPSFSDITTLRIEADDITPPVCYAWKTFLEVLSIPSLANLSMVGNIFLAPKTKDVRVVTMNNLKHLRYCDNDYMMLMLPFLRAPRLQTLAIRNEGGISEEEFEPNPFGFPPESCFFPSLQTLTLINSLPSSPDSAWRFMQMTKNIQSVQIFHDSLQDNFFDSLQERGPFNNECWPKLTSITADVSFWCGVEVIVAFAHSRSPNKIKLRLSKYTHDVGETEFRNLYKPQENLTVEVLEVEEEAEGPFKRPLWPPGVDCPYYAFRDDPFEL